MNTTSFLRNVLVGTAACLAPAAASHADLIAQWTFSTGTEADLTADVGGYVLTEGGTGGGQTTAFNDDGTVTIGNGRLLYAGDINSEDMPSLTENVTLWARVQIPTGDRDAFFFGLIDATSPADYGQMSMVARRNGESILPYGHTDTNTISPSSDPAAVPEGFFDIALVFQGGHNALGEPSEKDSIIRLYIDGEEVRVGVAPGSALQAFQSLGIGRLRGGTGILGGDMTIDEVRFYDEALTPDQISAIPEPAAGAILGLGGLLLVRSRAAKH